MTLRFWTVDSKGEIVHPTHFAVLPGLPKGLRREDAPGYLLSNTYAKVLGVQLPRREVLLGLATSMAATAVALRPARAIPLLVPVAISAVAVGAAAIKVFKATWGTFEAKNDIDDRAKGYVQLDVSDLKTDAIEGSIQVFYVFPANTQITIKFNRGPAATTKGDKLLMVAAEDSNDNDTFEAV